MILSGRGHDEDDGDDEEDGDDLKLIVEHEQFFVTEAMSIGTIQFIFKKSKF